MAATGTHHRAKQYDDRVEVTSTIEDAKGELGSVSESALTAAGALVPADCQAIVIRTAS